MYHKQRIEPPRGKTNNVVSQQVRHKPNQTKLYTVTAKLICVFVFAYADCWFSHGAAQMIQACLQKLIESSAN